MDLKKHIRSIPDYPKKGILFRDITTLIKNADAFKYVNDKIIEAEQLIAREESTKSEAIISLLVNSEFKGFLFFESVDESTFSVDQSTDYLEFFAQVISKHLESLLYK